jgi:hypothetical protein
MMSHKGQASHATALSEVRSAGHGTCSGGHSGAHHGGEEDVQSRDGAASPVRHSSCDMRHVTNDATGSRIAEALALEGLGFDVMVFPAWSLNCSILACHEMIVQSKSQVNISSCVLDPKTIFGILLGACR